MVVFAIERGSTQRARREAAKITKDDAEGSLQGYEQFSELALGNGCYFICKDSIIEVFGFAQLTQLTLHLPSFELDLLKFN